MRRRLSWLNLARCATLAIACGAALARADEPATRPMSPADVLKAAKAQAPDVEQLRAALRSPDPSVRVAAFSAMIESNNVTLTTLAINEGHGSADVVLRDLAARAAVKELRTIILDLGSNASKEAAERMRPFMHDRALNLPVEKYVWTTGEITLPYGARAQISAATLQFSDLHCRGVLTAVEGSWYYDGIVNCADGKNRFDEPVRARIR